MIAETANAKTCDCGARKSHRAIACHRCQYLDGRYALQAAVITALRGTDGMSVSDMCAELGFAGVQGGPQRGVFRVLNTLVEQKRLRRYQSDTDSGRWCWLYALDGRTQEGK